jgi:hypothetical protein
VAKVNPGGRALSGPPAEQPVLPSAAPRRIFQVGERMKTMLRAGLWLAILGLSAAAVFQKNVTVNYDIYIGFTAQCDCPVDGNPYFKKLSFDSVIGGVQFEFGKTTIASRKFNWWFASLQGLPVASRALLGAFGEGTIMDAELCPIWMINDYGKPYKSTLVKISRHFRPAIVPVDLAHIPHRGKILNPYRVTPPPDDNLDELLPLNFCVFQFKSFFYRQSETELEGSAARPTLRPIDFYSVLPITELREGKDASFEFPFKIPEVKNPGVLTIRYIPVKK